MQNIFYQVFVYIYTRKPSTPRKTNLTSTTDITDLKNGGKISKRKSCKNYLTFEISYSSKISLVTLYLYIFKYLYFVQVVRLKSVQVWRTGIKSIYLDFLNINENSHFNNKNMLSGFKNMKNIGPRIILLFIHHFLYIQYLPSTIPLLRIFELDLNILQLAWNIAEKRRLC